MAQIVLYMNQDPIVVTFQGTNEDVVISAPKLENGLILTILKIPSVIVKTNGGKIIATKQKY